MALMGRDKPHKMFLTLEAAREVLDPVFKAVPGKWDATSIQVPWHGAHQITWSAKLQAKFRKLSVTNTDRVSSGAHQLLNDREC